MIKLYKSLFLNKRFYIFISTIIALFFIGQYIGFLYYIALVMLILFVGTALYDIFLLYINNNRLEVSRELGDKLSNGDDNEIILKVRNNANQSFDCTIIDEVPEQFQMRENEINFRIAPKESLTLTYILRPTVRGEYKFSNINLFISSKVGLVQRKIVFQAEQSVVVLPSFLQMKKFAFLAISNRLDEYGVKKIRKRGASLEFEQIKEYTIGDDYRSINWKASAKRGNLMLNQYQDERSQNIINIIDKGRNMEMPFEGMALMDYAINSSLILSNIAVQKHDKAGLITFSKDIDTIQLPSKSKVQISNLQHSLYTQKTDYQEPNYEKLFLALRHYIKQRSLLLLYTNFETVSNMKRNLKYIQAIAKYHVVVVIIFENTEISRILTEKAETKSEIYRKVTAEKYAQEKTSIVELFNSSGIHTVLTKPNDLTVNTINKYLEIKSKRLV